MRKLNIFLNFLVFIKKINIKIFTKKRLVNYFLKNKIVYLSVFFII